VWQSANAYLISEETRPKNVKGAETVEYILRNRQWWRLLPDERPAETVAPIR
jgi:hypothetical protein